MIRHPSTPQAEIYAARLDAIQAAIRDARAPAGFSPWNCRLRKRRDEDILQGLAADLHARMIEARGAV